MSVFFIGEFFTIFSFFFFNTHLKKLHLHFITL